MKYQILSVPIISGEKEQENLDTFCTQHKVVDIEKQLIKQREIHYWSFCISYIDVEANLEGVKSLPANKKRIDYKEILNESDFNKYAELRELRKTIAEKNGVPVYTVFTNEQLATMVQQRIITLVQLQKVEGIGKSRLEKYAGSFLACLVTLFNET